MNIGFLTNISSPYKTLQINEFCKISYLEITVYYTEPTNKNIKWEERTADFKEVPLRQYRFLPKINIILNAGIIKIFNENDVIIVSGYEQLSMICLSFLCWLFNKPYIVFFDGISRYKLKNPGNIIKRTVKSFVANGSSAIMANGSIGRLYMSEVLGSPVSKIYNQYLSVDNQMINVLSTNSYEYRKFYRNKYNIDEFSRVLLYSGRVIAKKNLDMLIRSVSKLQKDDIVLLVTGGGDLEEVLKELAMELQVKLIITGYINEQTELFKHYFAADAMVLSSKDEPWGLVVNEGMAAGLPMIVSDVCGCSLDLVKDGVNGFLINPDDVDDIANKIVQVLYNDKMSKMGACSKEIISEWTFQNSRRNLELILTNLANHNDWAK